MFRGVVSAMAATVMVVAVVVADMMAKETDATKEKVRICSSDEGGNGSSRKGKGAVAQGYAR